MVTVYFHAKFHMSSSSDSLLIDINLKAEFHAAATLFNILGKQLP
jgi:hypothetical protein